MMSSDKERRDVSMATNLDADGLPVCPHCGCNRSEVTNTYPWSNGKRRRRRECEHCRMSFYTLQEQEKTES